MKKLILATCALTCAAGVFAQGTVIFNNRLTGTIVTHVYGPEPSDPTIAIQGNTSLDSVPGSTVYNGTLLAGTGFTAQLWAANGASQPVSSLLAASPTTTFRTGAAAGFINTTTATLAGVPLDAPVATIVMRVWDNAGGTILDYASATTKGESLPFNLSAIGGQANPAPGLVGLTSFNIHGIPEPSTFALAGLGAAALLIFRRRK